MTTDFLGDRKRSMEEAFFARRDQELRQQLKQSMAHDDWKAAIAAATGKDVAIVDELFKKGVERQTISALALIPMVEVAWANGSVTSSERSAVLRAAAENGATHDSPGYKLLEEWLGDNPHGKLLPAWKDYVLALGPTLGAEARSFLREEIGRRAESVAEAAGGFLGLGDKVSVEEKRVLREIEQTLAQIG